MDMLQAKEEIKAFYHKTKQDINNLDQLVKDYQDSNIEITDALFFEGIKPESTGFTSIYDIIKDIALDEYKAGIITKEQLNRYLDIWAMDNYF